ncbi:hypothetical protein EJB05_44016, partial [Eragrostis curvula]
MGLSAAVHWWEESQLRVLVLSSLVVQWLLLFFSSRRDLPIQGWCRSMIWLAYLGSDSLAIYGLATLFNRHGKNPGAGGGSSSSSVLEVVWAPVLLMHLGGQDGITAYNLEDNELWTRHALTAVSQVTVAIYVFSKSWPGGDKRLLQAAILLFIVGIIKCFEKPWALKSASINSLVSSSELVRKTTNREAEVEGFVREAKAFVQEQTEADERGAFVQDSDHPEGEDEESIASWFQNAKITWESLKERYREAKKAKPSAQGDDHPESPEEGVVSPTVNDEKPGVPLQLFVDLTCPIANRLAILKFFWLRDEKKIYPSLRVELFNVLRLLYTKYKISPDYGQEHLPSKDQTESSKGGCSAFVRVLRALLPWAAIGLFHHSHREAYNDTDVKITYALLCCTAILEGLTIFVLDTLTTGEEALPVTVSQYDLIGFFVCNRNHTKKLSIVSFFGLKDYLEQHWWIKSCYSSCKIVGLVNQYVKTGWKKDIHDAASYRMFNDNMGQRTLQLNDCKHLAWSLNRPFDESVLLWHIATDFCFYSCSFTGHECVFPQGTRRIQRESPGGQTGPQCGQLIDCKANTCRQMSNYMMYLLFINPEMLLPGSRRNLFTTAYRELEDVLTDIEPPVEEKGLVLRINSEMQSTNGSQEEGFIHDAWSLAQGLQALGDEKMWEVIQGVWLEMLCFSAGRCRGYLHAKALGAGGELLTYVWLLLSNMGMETFAERLQRVELSSGGGNTAASPSTSEVPNGGSAPPTSAVTSGATPSTSSEVPTVADPSTSKVASGAAPSTSEIRFADEDDMV